MSKGLESSRKPTNFAKTTNFVGRVRGLKVFIGDFAYECDFMILDDTTSIIEEDMGELVLGKPFVDTTGLTYNVDKRTVKFELRNETVTFLMPPKIELDTQGEYINTDAISPIVLENFKDSGREYYMDSIMLGPEYN